MEYVFIYICVAHYLGDWHFQNSDMAKYKAVSTFWLSIHVLVYGIVCFGVYEILQLLNLDVVPDGYPVYNWISVNITLHWMTDYFTSKESLRYHTLGDTQNFFRVVGFDQFLHFMTWFTTFNMFS